MLHFMLNLCAFLPISKPLGLRSPPMPSTSPSARTDCPSTASRGDGQQTRHESGQPCPMPQESTTRPAPRPDGHAAPMPSTCPPRSNRQSQPETARTSEEGEEHEGRKGEKMRTCARLPAVLPSKSYIDRTPPQTASPAPPQASRHPSPHRLKLPVSRRTPARFCLCQFCFWRVCRTPARFRPSADEQRHPARLPGRHRHRGSLHIFAPAPFLMKRLSTSTLSRTPHIPIFHSGTISTIPQQ